MTTVLVALGVMVTLGGTWWSAFLSGRRYECGIWERWIDREVQFQEERKNRRGVVLRKATVSRKQKR